MVLTIESVGEILATEQYFLVMLCTCTALYKVVITLGSVYKILKLV